MLDLTQKYRPQTFTDIIGQEAVVKSLQEQVSNGNLAPCLLFSGEPGLGKTSTARVVAKSLGCNDSNILEFNSSDKNSIDDIREILDFLSFVPFGTNKHRVIILDEVHRLSKNAFDALLKPLEEPPSHVHWILCSTEPTKIPKAILSRCTPPDGYKLKKVENATLKTFLTNIVEKEKLEIASNILTLIVMKSDGSPRRALKYLQSVQNVKSLEEAKEIIKSSSGEDNASAIDLCRLLLTESTWEDITKAIKGLEDQDPESVRLIVVSYMNKVALGAKSDDTLAKALKVLMTFMERQCYNGEKLAPITLMCAKVILMGD